LNPKALWFEVTGDDGPNGPLYTVSNFEGQVKVQVLFNPQNRVLNANLVTALIKKILGDCGEVKAIQSISGIASVKAYYVEFFDIRSAKIACARLNNKDIAVSRGFHPPPTTAEALTA
jgi:hypothetical protein